MELMAWSLSTEERARIQDYFEAMDVSQRGTITLQELKAVITDKFHIPEGEAVKVFQALTAYHDESIHYTDFLAAMLDTRIVMHDGLIRATFKRFDSDNSGFITLKDLREVIGDHFEGESVEKMLAEMDVGKHNKVSYEEFVSYLRDPDLGLRREISSEVVDTLVKSELNRQPSLKQSMSSVLYRHRPSLEWRTVSGASQLRPVAPPPCSAPSAVEVVVPECGGDTGRKQPQCCVIS